MNNILDLSTVPAPDIVEQISYAEILAGFITQLQTLEPEYLSLNESDPAYKILEIAAGREVIIRQRINDAAKACMLTYATGSNLENLSSFYGVFRNTISPEDDTTFPVTPAVMESDSALRYRTQLALQGISTAGPIGAYKYHALSVAGVFDVGIQGPPDTSPGNVTVTVMSGTGTGAASSGLLALVTTALNNEDVRPLTDTVTVKSVTVLTFSVVAVLHISAGPDPATILTAATASVNAFLSSMKKVGASIRVSALYASLNIGGVNYVTLSSPGITADFICSAVQTANCSSVTLTTA